MSHLITYNVVGKIRVSRMVSLKDRGMSHFVILVAGRAIHSECMCAVCLLFFPILHFSSSHICISAAGFVVDVSMYACLLSRRIAVTRYIFPHDGLALTRYLPGSSLIISNGDWF